MDKVFVYSIKQLNNMFVHLRSYVKGKTILYDTYVTVICYANL